MASKASSSIDAREAAHFGAMASDWWNPKGSSAMLHQLNPVRLGYIRSAINAHWGLDRHMLRPLSGRPVMDVGCGAGLLCEPLARLGGIVTGLDAAPENIAAAKDHAAQGGILVDYRAQAVETLTEAPFDLITSMEVIEHVTDPARFVAELGRRLAKGGLLILSTPNRTPLSRLAMIDLAEGLGKIPKGTHDWNKFVTPDELEGMLETAGLEMTDISGIGFSPARGLHLSDNKALNYILAARHKRG